jgi:hypothetical protein
MGLEIEGVSSGTAVATATEESGNSCGSQRDLRKVGKKALILPLPLFRSAQERRSGISCPRRIPAKISGPSHPRPIMAMVGEQAQVS